MLDADNTGYKKSSVDGLSIGSTFGILVVVLITYQGDKRHTRHQFFNNILTYTYNITILSR